MKSLITVTVAASIAAGDMAQVHQGVLPVMREGVLRRGSQVIIERCDLDPLVEVLHRQGYRVVGPVMGDGAIRYGEVSSLADLPVGWGDEHCAGRYHLTAPAQHALSHHW